LFQRLIESGNYEEAQEFAQALSYVNDPIAVPYLVKSLTSNKMVEPILIKGLERIGNKEAVQVLIDTIVDKPESEVALLATSSLQIIESNGLNVEGKQMAKQFLKSK
jgi:HEAT repeat protein